MDRVEFRPLQYIILDNLKKDVSYYNDWKEIRKWVNIRMKRHDLKISNFIWKNINCLHNVLKDVLKDVKRCQLFLKILYNMNDH